MSVSFPAPGGVILFDLDDTLILATDMARAMPIFKTHTGYATIVKVGEGKGAVSMFVAIRPFALASIVMLLNAGYKVGFWSAGSPSYVSAIVRRLIDAVRLLQAKKTRVQSMMEFKPFEPVAVIALDQQRLKWVRLLSEENDLPRMEVETLVPCPSRDITKYMHLIQSTHPNLSTYSERAILLIDNLPQDIKFTHQVQAFEPPQSASGTEAPLDKTLLTLSRTIVKSIA
jgi:hypothetical protein